MISENKLKHMIGVARECERLAKEKHATPAMQTACFMMGLLHDIGYEKCNENDIESHGEKGREMIKSFKKYEHEIMDAIAKHGNAMTCSSLFDTILNTADLTIDHEGNRVSVEERLAEIKDRYKDTNPQYYAQARQQAIALFMIEPNEDENPPSVHIPMSALLHSVSEASFSEPSYKPNQTVYQRHDPVPPKPLPPETKNDTYDYDVFSDDGDDDYSGM